MINHIEPKRFRRSDDVYVIVHSQNYIERGGGGGEYIYIYIYTHTHTHARNFGTV